jgi:hypothetical protein
VCECYVWRTAFNAVLGQSTASVGAALMPLRAAAAACFFSSFKARRSCTLRSRVIFANVVCLLLLMQSSSLSLSRASGPKLAAKPIQPVRVPLERAYIQHVRIGRRNTKLVLQSAPFAFEAPRLSRVARRCFAASGRNFVQDQSPHPTPASIFLRRAFFEVVGAPGLARLRWLNSSGFRSRKVRLAARSDAEGGGALWRHAARRHNSSAHASRH